MTPLVVDWRPIEPPRSPVAVLAEGESARRLAEGVIRRLAAGADLRAAVGGGALLVLGQAEDLPWAPGATYLARELGVLVPTTVTPTVPMDLLVAAVRQLLTRQHKPRRHVAVLPGRVITFNVADTPTDATQLRQHAHEAFA